jgi:hypothetical protein
MAGFRLGGAPIVQDAARCGKAFAFQAALEAA